MEVVKMAANVFHHVIVYSIFALTCAYLEPKEEQLSSVKAVYEEKDVFLWVPMVFGKSLCYQILPFIFDHKLGLIDSGKNGAVLIVSQLVFLMVDQIQKL